MDRETNSSDHGVVVGLATLALLVIVLFVLFHYYGLETAERDIEEARSELGERIQEELDALIQPESAHHKSKKKGKRPTGIRSIYHEHPWTSKRLISPIISDTDSNQDLQGSLALPRLPPSAHTYPPTRN